MNAIRFSSGYATINSLNMYYEIYGNGAFPLVLIHGGGSTIQTTFGKIIPILAEHCKIIAVELQAHGHTSDRNTPETFEQDADDVAALLKDIGISKASFFGFSNGGNTVMQIAIRHPQIIEKLIIASAFYKREGMIGGFFDGMQNASLENMPEPLQAAFLAITPDKNKLQAMHDKDKNRMLGFKDWPDDDLRSVKAPALVLAADHDVVLPEHSAAMARLISGARLMILPGTHGSYIGEICSPEPDKNILFLTVKVFVDFLNG